MSAVLLLAATGAWWRHGQILEKKGRKDEAAAAYGKSLDIRPG